MNHDLPTQGNPISDSARSENALVVGALGVIVGGMVGDRIGRDRVIWISILGALPFALMLPYSNLLWTGALSVLISLIMSRACTPWTALPRRSQFHCS